jgi:hypothetical protein
MAQKRSGVSQASKADKPKKLLKGGVDPSVGAATQFQPGQSGNPDGPKPGYKHLSTHIQDLLNDEKFSAWVSDPRYGAVEFKGRPMEAIIRAQAVRAMNGDPKAADWLAKYGYGTKIEVTGADGEPLIPIVRIIDERPKQNKAKE